MAKIKGDRQTWVKVKSKQNDTVHKVYVKTGTMDNYTHIAEIWSVLGRGLTYPFFLHDPKTGKATKFKSWFSVSGKVGELLMPYVDNFEDEDQWRAD